MKLKEQQVKELDDQMVHVKQIEPEKEAIIEARKAAVAERYVIEAGNQISGISFRETLFIFLLKYFF